jgi:uncharacterized protein (TIGR02246 family)
MKSHVVAGLALLAVIAACAPQAAPPPAQPDAAAIRKALDGEMVKMVPALAAKDGATFASYFTDDAVWILPDATTFHGRAEVEKGAKAFIESFESIALGAVTIDKLIVVNDTEVVTFSHGSMTITMKGKKTAETHNNPFADYWKKGADGMWRIAYEVNAEGVMPDPAAKKD